MANYDYEMYGSAEDHVVVELLEQIELCSVNDDCSECNLDDKCNLCDTNGRICHEAQTDKPNCCAGSKLYSMNFWKLLMKVEMAE